MVLIILMIFISIVLGAIGAYIHKRKGYSLVAGFCWGFLCGLLGLAVVLLEQTAEERKELGKTGLSIFKLIIIFILIVELILFIKLTLSMFASLNIPH